MPFVEIPDRFSHTPDSKEEITLSKKKRKGQQDSGETRSGKRCKREFSMPCTTGRYETKEDFSNHAPHSEAKGTLMRNIKITHKIYLLATMIVLIILVTGITTISRINQANNEVKEFAGKTAPLAPLESLKSLYSLNITQTSYGILNKTIDWETAQKNARAASTQIPKTRALLSADSLTDQKMGELGILPVSHADSQKSAQDLYTSLSADWEQADKAVAEFQQIVSAPDADATEKLEEFASRLPASIFPVSETIDTIIKAQTAVAADPVQQQSIFDSNETLTRSLWVLIIGGITIAIGAGAGLASSIRKPLRELLQTVQATAREGNIRQDVSYYRSNDEVGQLSDAFRELTDYLNTQAQTVTDLARGETRRTLTVKSPTDVLGMATAGAQAAIGTLVSETKNISQAAANGHLNERMSTTGLEGAWNEISKSFNTAMGSIATVLDATQMGLDRLAAKNLLTRIDIDFPGEYNTIKHRFNTALDSLESGMAQVAESADSVAQVSFALTMSSDALANSASLQSYAVDSINESLQEISASAQNSAMNAAIGVAAVQEAGRSVKVCMDIVPEGELADLFRLIYSKVDVVENHINDIAMDSAKQSESLTAVEGALQQIKAVTDEVAGNSDEAAKAVSQLSEQANSLADLAGDYELRREKAHPPSILKGKTTVPLDNPASKDSIARQTHTTTEETEQTKTEIIAEQQQQTAVASTASFSAPHFNLSTAQDLNEDLGPDTSPMPITHESAHSSALDTGEIGPNARKTSRPLSIHNASSLLDDNKNPPLEPANENITTPAQQQSESDEFVTTPDQGFSLFDDTRKIPTAQYPEEDSAHSETPSEQSGDGAPPATRKTRQKTLEKTAEDREKDKGNPGKWERRPTGSLASVQEDHTQDIS